MLDKTTITKTAQKFVSKGQIDKAIAEWGKLLKESHDGNVYNIVGDLYLKKKAKKEATEAFSKAADIFREDGFYLKSIALYKKILNVSPLEVDAYLALAELNAEKGLIGSANENYLAAAEIYIKAGSIEKALGIYQEIMKLAPSNINLKMKVTELYLKMGLNQDAVNEYIAIASHYLEKGENEKAQEFYLKAIGFDSQNISAHIGMSKIAENADDIKQAYEYLNKTVSFAPDNCDVLFNFSRLALKTDKVKDAKETLEKLIKIDPADMQYKKTLGLVYIKEGSLEKSWEVLLPCIDEMISSEKWDEPLELLNNFQEMHPVEVKSRFVNIYKGKNDKDAAMNELKEIIKIYDDKGLSQEALRSYKELLELNPADENVQAKIKELEKELGFDKISPEVFVKEKPAKEVLAKADEYISQDLMGEATDLLDKLKGKEPDNIEARIKLKEIYIKLKEKDKAIGECLFIAELYEKKGDLEAKNTIIAEATGLNPEDPRLITINMPSPDIDEVGAAPEKPTEAAPVSEAASAPDAAPAPGTEKSTKALHEQMEEADFYAQQGLVDEAVNLYQKMLSSFPDNEDVRKKLNEIKPEEVPAEEAKPTGAVDSDIQDIFKEFKKGIEEELGGEDSDTRYNLGIAYKEMGLVEDAIREFKISAKDPKKAVQSSSMLALCYMEKKIYPLAIQEFKKVYESVSSDHDNYLGAKCDLADAYVKNKDYGNSLKLYTEIHAKDPKFGDVARKVEIIKKLVSEGKEKPKSKKDRVSYI